MVSNPGDYLVVMGSQSVLYRSVLMDRRVTVIINWDKL